MNPVLVNNIDHADLHVAIRAGARYGDNVNQMPIFPSEFEEAQRSFPIVFRRGEGGVQAYVLLGLDRDENLFLSGDRWTSAYVPAIQRRGPFSIGVARPAPGVDTPGEPMIHVDMDDPRVGGDGGLPLFLEQGGNAPLLNHMADVLRVIYEGMESATEIYATLEDAGLLQPISLQITISEEQGYELPDLMVIDQDALAALSGETLTDLHRRGLLRAAIMAASSLGTMQHLIDLKNRRAATE